MLRVTRPNAFAGVCTAACLLAPALALGAGVRLALPLAHPRAISQATVSPDGTLLATTDLSGASIFWNIRQRAQLTKVVTPSGFPPNRVIIADGEHAFVHVDDTILQYEIISGSIVQRIDGVDVVADFGVTRTGSVFAVAKNAPDRILLWEPGHAQKMLDSPCATKDSSDASARISSIDVSRDGTHLAILCERFKPFGKLPFPTQLSLFIWQIGHRPPLPIIVKTYPSPEVQSRQLQNLRFDDDVPPWLQPERCRFVTEDGALVAVGPNQLISTKTSAAVSEEIIRRLPPLRGLSVLKHADERFLLANVLAVYDASTARIVFTGSKGPLSAVIGYSDRYHLVFIQNPYGGRVEALDMVRQSFSEPMDAIVTPIRKLDLSDNQQYLTVSTGFSVRIWDLSAGREEARVMNGSTYSDFGVNRGLGLVLAIGASGRVGGVIDELDLSSGQTTEIESVDGHPVMFWNPKFSGEGTALLTGDAGHYQVLDVTNWRPAGGPLVGAPVTSHLEAISQSGEFVFAGGLVIGPPSGAGVLWNTRTGKSRNLTWNPAFETAVFSPDGSLLVAASKDRTLGIWNTKDGSFSQQAVSIPEAVTLDPPVLAFSPSGRHLLLAIGQHVAMVDTESWTSTSTKITHPEGITCAILTADTGKILTGGNDGAVRFWSADGHELAALAAFDETASWHEAVGAAISPKHNRHIAATSPDWALEIGNSIRPRDSGRSGWMVFVPENRFDTSNFDDTRAMHWIVGNSIHTIPLESLMKEGFEPNLLKSALSEPRPNWTSITVPTSVEQPEVTFKRVSVESDEPDAVAVSLRISGIATHPNTQRSGWPALRLLLDGQLVREVDLKSIAQGRHPSLSCETSIPPKTRFELDVTCRRVMLPDVLAALNPRRSAYRVNSGSPAANGSVLLSAYAFSDTGVKSKTEYYRVDRPAQFAPKEHERIAYVLAVGVSANATDGAELKHAAADAEDFAREIGNTIRATGIYDHTLQVVLRSYYRRAGDKVTRSLEGGRKNMIRAVVRSLAGESNATIPPWARCSISNSRECLDSRRPATPNDLVILYVSGHGYTDSTDQFFIAPSDLRTDNKGNPIAKSMVSAQDLAEWMAGIKAGSITLILDTCYSQEAIANKTFRPGPFGSQSLGELAFVKGMRILAASRGTTTEQTDVDQGLLAYTIITDWSQHRQPNEPITLSTWLRYSANALHRNYDAHVVTWYRKNKGPNFADVAADEFSPPALFDFASADRDPWIFFPPSKNVAFSEDR